MDAFAADPDLPNRPNENHRYYAACCAARAGCGDGQDVVNLSEKERRALRERARGWLRDDLAAMNMQLASEPKVGRAMVSKRLESWFKDAALAGVRDDAALDKLPSVEREAWRALWRDAQSLLAQTKPV
jgi:eukaryotic-like serine/threonine-protein kinase